MKKQKGCVYPDCFNCPLPDCRLEKGMKESAQINSVLKDVLHPKKQIKEQKNDSK